MNNAAKSAYPTLDYNQDYRHLELTEEGLSKRERIAMEAMKGILSNNWCINQYGDDIKIIDPGDVAIHAIRYTDALLKELEKSPAP